MEKGRYFVSESEVTPYSPANHDETVNRRLIGPETVRVLVIYSPPYGESKEKGIPA